MFVYVGSSGGGNCVISKTLLLGKMNGVCLWRFGAEEQHGIILPRARVLSLTFCRIYAEILKKPNFSNTKKYNQI